MNNNSNGNNNSSSPNFGTPSPVLHIRSVPPEATENDLLTCIQTYTFGRPVVAVRILDKLQQALVETDSVETATRVIALVKDSPITLHGKTLQISYSKSKSINNRPIGNVLLCTIENANMAVTVDILNHFFSLYGEVLRIVIFNKNELQALVEFSNPESAFNAKKHLHNASMYQGGFCVLKIEISKTEHLNVTLNNDRTRDYTKNLPSENPNNTTSSYYKTPSNGNITNNNNSVNNLIGGGRSISQPQQRIQPSSSGSYNQQNHNQQYVNNNAHLSFSSSRQQQQQHQINDAGKTLVGGGMALRTAVLMIYGLDESMTCDRIFNLLCIYGNVQKIKILPNKKGTAMVQMEDSLQADAIINYYNQMTLFGQPLHVMYSKHQTITDSHNPESANNSRDYTHTPFKRFTHSISTYKHLYKPSQTLYFSNVPKDFTESAFQQLFASMNTHKPIAFKTFTLQQQQQQTQPQADSSNNTTPNNNNNNTTPNTVATNPQPTTNGNNVESPTTASASTAVPARSTDKIVGLLEFASVQHALEALVVVNNTPLPGSNIRLSFSNSSVIPALPKSQQQQS